MPSRGLQVEQGAGQLVFSGGALSSGRARVAGRSHYAGAGGGHLSEDFRLVGCVPLDGIHQVRDEVGALLQLHIDLRPTVLHTVLQRHQVVIGADAPTNQDNDNNDNNDADDQTSTHLCSFARPCCDHSSTLARKQKIYHRVFIVRTCLVPLYRRSPVDRPKREIAAQSDEVFQLAPLRER